MKYKLEVGYKSLEPFESELPDFVILTGVNGVGKTQILQSLQNAISKIITDGTLVPSHKIKYIEKLLPVTDLSPIHRGDHHNYGRYDYEDPLFIGYSRFYEFKGENHESP